LIINVLLAFYWCHSPLSTDQLHSSISASIDDVAGWMASNGSS